MVATDGQPDLNGLSAWQEALMRQAEDIRADIKGKQDDLAQIEERLSLVTKLIEVETRAPGSSAPPQDGETIASPNQETPAPSGRRSKPDIEDAVEDLLREAGEPLHISNIRETLVARGVPIPGRGDDANIIVRLRRFENRFTRTARGTYGLAEWGLPALASKAHKRRRRVAR